MPFFPSSFFFPPFPFSFLSSFFPSLQLGCSAQRLAARSSVSGEDHPALVVGRRVSSVRPAHGRRWLWSHPCIEAGNREAVGKRLGRWFHLAAPLISLLELVEVFNAISLPFSTLTPFKNVFFFLFPSPPTKKETSFWGGFFVSYE